MSHNLFLVYQLDRRRHKKQQYILFDTYFFSNFAAENQEGDTNN